MKVDFKCKSCGNIEEIEYKIQVGPPKEVECPVCGGVMKRLFTKENTGSVQIDEWFGDHTTTAVTDKMKKSRPSGKDKTLY